MTVSKPKKKKLLIILIILLSRMSFAVENDSDLPQTIDETILGQLDLVKPQMYGDDESWTEEQEAVWTCVEALANAYDPGNLSLPDFPALSADLQTALEALR